MGSATADPPLPAATDRPLQLDSIPTVDLRVLSQSELYSLSMCSESAFDASDDVVSPKLDRSVFNESAGSRKQTYSRLRLAPASSVLRRRTHHLRSINHNSNQPSAETDPENFQIVSILKQLFSVERNPGELIPIPAGSGELIPIPVGSGELIPIPVDYSKPIAQLPNVAPDGLKRKRGRPRKDKSLTANLKLEHPSPSKGDFVKKELVIYENSVDMDKEIVNADGVPVDLVALGSLQDPFAMELRRRTEGLEGEVKLLGFLQGLNGQWVSRRKKRRIVDASEFGNTLPIGWKLLLSLKRKTGYVWVYCRRYISPSGRQFVSCKEVSIYLLSLHGEQSTAPLNSVESTRNIVEGDTPASTNTTKMVQIADKPASTDTTKMVQIADKPASTNTAKMVQIADKPASTDTTKMVQIADNVALDVTNKETIACHVASPPVSNMVINDPVQDTLMPGNLQEVNVVDIAHCKNCNLDFDNKDGLMQHQSSCHKRKRSKNGQSITDGVIIKDGKFECQFCHKSFEERHRYNGHVGAHVKNQVKSENESLQMNVSSQTDSTLQEPAVLEQVFSQTNCFDGNFDNQDGEDLKSFDKSKSADEPEDSFSIKSTGCSNSEAILPNDDNTINCCPVVAEDAAHKDNICYDQQQRDSGICSPFPLDIVENTTMGDSSGSVLHCSSINVEACDFDELQLEKGRPDVNKESISGLLCINSSMMDENNLNSVQLPGEADDVPMNDVTASSILTVPETNRGSEDGLKTLSVDVEDRIDNLNLFFSTCVDEHGESNNDHVSNLVEENHFGCTPSWGKDINSAEKYGSQFPDPFEEREPMQQKTLDSSLLSLSGYEKNNAIENYVDNVSTTKVDNLNVNDLQNVNNDELIFPFGSSHSHACTDLKQDRNLHFSLFDDDNENKAFKSNVEMYDQERSETGAGIYTNNSLGVPKINGLLSSGHQDLNLTFGSSCVEFGANAANMMQLQLEQEGYPTGRSSFQLGMEQTYGAQNSLVHHIDHRRVVEHHKQGVQSSSFNSKFGDFGNNYNNTVFPNSCWEEQRIGKFGNAVQTNKGTMDGSIWRNNAGNLLNHGGMAANPNSLGQSSNCFQAYNLISNKGEGVYDRSEGLRSERSEPVEYSFMGTQSLRCGQQEPKGFSYEVEMGQGYNSSFWVGKDGLASGRNVVPTVCIWCSSTFYQEAIQSGATQGAVGSMCPTCSARIL